MIIEKDVIIIGAGASGMMCAIRKESNEAGVNIILNCRILDVKKTERFIISTDHEILESESLVIATGGLSHAGTGASGIGYDIAKRFGLKVTGLRPALVPFIFSEKDQKTFEELSGISIDVTGQLGGFNLQWAWASGFAAGQYA